MHLNLKRDVPIVFQRKDIRNTQMIQLCVLTVSFFRHHQCLDVVIENNRTSHTNRFIVLKITFTTESVASMLSFHDIIVANNIVTRHIKCKGLGAIGMQVVCMPIDDKMVLMRKSISCFTEMKLLYAHVKNMH